MTEPELHRAELGWYFRFQTLLGDMAKAGDADNGPVCLAFVTLVEGIRKQNIPRTEEN